MGISLGLVWNRRDGPDSGIALVLFALQLLLNIGWSACFLSLRSPRLGLAEIVLLWLGIAATMLATWQVSGLPALLLVP